MHGLFVEDNIQGHKKVKFFGLQKQIAVLLALQDTQDFALFEYYGEIFRWAEFIDPLVHRLAIGLAEFSRTSASVSPLICGFAGRFPRANPR